MDLILECSGAGAASPQLSRAYPQELMWIQVTEGLPRFQVDLEAQNYHFDTSGDPVSEIEQFYAHYLAVTEGSSVEAFAISPRTAEEFIVFWLGSEVKIGNSLSLKSRSPDRSALR